MKQSPDRLVGAFYFYRMKVTVIGSGKVARNLMAAFQRQGILGEAYARSEREVREISERYEIVVQSHLDFTESSSSLFLMVVSDAAISELAMLIRLPQSAILAHTSGTIGIEALGSFDRRGVFYPLMTFAEEHLVDLSTIPFLIEGSNQEVERNLQDLGRHLGSRVELADSKRRATIHLAAVFASNFTNRMLRASERILEWQNLDLELLGPLIVQTIENVLKRGAEASLTGPAMRGDRITVDSQLAALSKHPDLQQVYELISKQIMK